MALQATVPLMIIGAALTGIFLTSKDTRYRELQEQRADFEFQIKYGYGIVPPRTKINPVFPSNNLHLEHLTDYKPFTGVKGSQYIVPGSAADPYGPNNAANLKRDGGLVFMNHVEANKYIQTPQMADNYNAAKQEYFREHNIVQPKTTMEKLAPITYIRAIQEKRREINNKTS